MDYRDLNVYKSAFELGEWAGMFARSLRPPFDTTVGVQIIRSARSVTANIAEAWRKRIYPAHFVSKITDAEAEAAETQMWVEYAYSDGLIDAATCAKQVQAYDRILRQLVNLRRRHVAGTRGSDAPEPPGRGRAPRHSRRREH